MAESLPRTSSMRNELVPSAVSTGYSKGAQQSSDWRMPSGGGQKAKGKYCMCAKPPVARPLENGVGVLGEGLSALLEAEQDQMSAHDLPFEGDAFRIVVPLSVP